MTQGDSHLSSLGIGTLADSMGALLAHQSYHNYHVRGSL